MGSDTRARPADQALAVPVEPASGLDPTGFDPSREQILEKIIRDTLWMACRYAHGRQSYAVAMYNDAARAAVEANVVRFTNLSGEPIFAIDGSRTRAMSGLSEAEFSIAMAGWFRNDAIPQHCRNDWITSDSDGSGGAGETAQTGSTVGDSADPKGIAQVPSSSHPTEGS